MTPFPMTHRPAYTATGCVSILFSLCEKRSHYLHVCPIWLWVQRSPLRHTQEPACHCHCQSVPTDAHHVDRGHFIRVSGPALVAALMSCGPRDLDVPFVDDCHVSRDVPAFVSYSSLAC